MKIIRNLEFQGKQTAVCIGKFDGIHKGHRLLIEQAKKEGRKGLVLTCKDKLLHYYEDFGFVNEGVSKSVHGNVVWYQMRLML